MTALDRRVVFLFLTLASLALLLYTVGAPHEQGGWSHEGPHRCGVREPVRAGAVALHGRRALHPRRL